MSEIAPVVIYGLSHIPGFAHGHVREFRLRWACEEAGIAYAMEMIDNTGPRPADYLARQPFNQVPAITHGGVEMFESSAILLYLAQLDGGHVLLPADTAAHWRAVSWVLAGANSIDTQIAPLQVLHHVATDAPWQAEAVERFIAPLRRRLAGLSAALGAAEWIAGDFSIADIQMVCTLRQLDDRPVLAEFPNLVDLIERGMARPAFARAMAAHLADVGPAITWPPVAAPAPELESELESEMQGEDA